MTTNEDCPFIEKSCPHLAKSHGELYCGHATHPNKISEIKQCPFVGGKKHGRAARDTKKMIRPETEDREDLFTREKVGAEFVEKLGKL